MKRFFKTTFVFIMSLVILSNIVLPLSADEIIDNSEPYTYNVEKIGNVYLITEYGVTATIEYFFEDEVVKYNEKYYSMKNFINASNDQIIDNVKYPIGEYLKNYKDISYEPMNSTFLLRSYNSPPTSGYGTLRYVGYIKVYDYIYLNLTATVISAAAGAWEVAIDKAADLIQDILENWGVQNGTMFNKTWQANHPSCPAFKEERIPAFYSNGKYIDLTAGKNTIYEWTAPPSEQYCW